MEFLLKRISFLYVIMWIKKQKFLRNSHCESHSMLLLMLKRNSHPHLCLSKSCWLCLQNTSRIPVLPSITTLSQPQGPLTGIIATASLAQSKRAIRVIFKMLGQILSHFCPKSSKILMKSESVSRSVVSNSLWPHGLWPTRLLCPWNSPGKNIGVGCHSLFQGIFPTPGIKPMFLILQTDSW